MKVLKPFVAAGRRYQVGDDAPAELDEATIAHYHRHGMVGQPDAVAPAVPAAPAAPSTSKPAMPAQAKPATPPERKPAQPPQRKARAS